MNATHTWELQIADTTFEGECEYTNAGLLQFSETGETQMSGRLKEALRQILDILGPLPEEYTDLKSFELKIK